ncbi:hypothetical protein HW115_18795 [Verrucomicrobiaceae bacterium N1E253]|uniref:DUF3015 domain-containing protein n=1 Tax=Oceaniferula marina TaxID=2748318 RepID=A0A851GJI1_9BACT|nr:hypothetical protein [Oceaniferula marina]NWK57673.1 hypothetical protein [Oceaniferula marina]
MKIIAALTLACLCLTTSISQADPEEGPLSQTACTAIGGLGAMAVYNAHVALGRIADANLENPEELQRAALDAGGIKGGTGAIIGIYKKCMPQAGESEKEGFQMLLNMTQLVEQQADALIEVLKIKSEGKDTHPSRKKLAEIRAKCAKNLAKNLGFEEAIVK